MRLKASRKTLGVLNSLLVSLALTTLLFPASAAPQELGSPGLSRRAGRQPGIGVKLELVDIQLKKDVQHSAEDLEKAEGAEITPVGFTGDPKTNWKPTAEISPPSSNLSTEAIVIVVENKVGHKRSKAIGKEILKYFKDWAPCRKDGCKVNIEGFDNLHPWTVQWPKDPLDLDQVKFSPQVRTAMPLEALLEILADAKAGKLNPLLGKSPTNRDKIKVLKKDDFKPFNKIIPADITDEFLGFFSFLTSYCVVAKFGTARYGPERSFSIMPRNDFVAQYNQFVRDKLREQLCDGTTSLYDIVQTVSEQDDTLAKQQFMWTPPKDMKPIDEKWDGKEKDLAQGTLEVGKFLAHLQGYDKSSKNETSQMDLLKIMDRAMSHSQIGGLDNRMEDVLGTRKPAPIFEFRDLDPIKAAELGDKMASYEDKVIALHKKAAMKRSIEVRAVSNGTCKSTTTKPKCPYAQIWNVTSNGCKACPSGMEANAAGDKCQCRHNYFTKPGWISCVMCRHGFVVNTAGDKCVRNRTP